MSRFTIRTGTRRRNMRRGYVRIHRDDARLRRPKGTHMSTTASKRRPASRRVALPTAPAEELSRPRLKKWRLLSALGRVFRSCDQGEATFYRLEYRSGELPPRYTGARDVQSQIDMLGPPPLGL